MKYRVIFGLSQCVTQFASNSALKTNLLLKGVLRVIDMRTRGSGSTTFIVPASKKCAGDRAFSLIAPRCGTFYPCEY